MNAAVNRIAHAGELEVLMATYAAHSGATQYMPPPRVMVDRVAARTAAWYEFFPRSAEGRADRGSTFRDCLRRASMTRRRWASTCIYFPPIHPIGLTNRKGRNNSVTCQPGEPGVPYAIGNRHLGCPNGGGHKDIEPSLGTFEDFAWLEKQIRRRGMEIALDFAINCSPDHPYVAEHPEWFYKRPDGTIKYAENPPKKYEDIYPLNFRCANWQELWEEMKSIMLFWAERGVRIFRVDNPHTKPVAFWELLICRRARKISRHDFPLGGVHPTEDDEGAGQGRLHPELHLLHLAHEQAGADRVFHRADADRDARIFSRQSLHQHAGYPAVSSPNRRPADVPNPRRAGGDAVERLRHLQRLRALRKCRAARPRGVSRFGEISAQRTRLGRARETSRS